MVVAVVVLVLVGTSGVTNRRRTPSVELSVLTAVDSGGVGLVLVPDGPELLLPTWADAGGAELAAVAILAGGLTVAAEEVVVGGVTLRGGEQTKWMMWVLFSEG